MYRSMEDITMRTYDLTPLYRSAVGFDRFASILDNVLSADSSQSGYPPYNIEKLDGDSYRITIAVAGFTDDELNIETREGQLVISGKKTEATQDVDVNFLHRGIATRAFEKRFQLAEHVRATGATTENGLLHVDLMREVPEALKPRKIEISGRKQIQGKLDA